MPKYLDTNGLRTLWAQITNKIGQESSATEEALDAKLDSLKKDLITIVEKEGSIVSTETISGLSIRPTSYIESTQSGSGDPSPSNIRAIGGWDEVNVIRTGKNLAAITDKDTTSSGVTIGIKDGIVTMNGTSTSNSGTVSLWKTVLKPGKYTLSHNVLAGEMVNAPENASVLNVGSSRTRLNAPALTFTVNEEAEYNFSIVRASSAVTYDNFTFSVQLECGETATEFETPNTQTLAATLPETVYGGVMDWTTGVLTVNKAEYSLSSVSSWKQLTGKKVFYCSNPAGMLPASGWGDIDKPVCSHYVYQPTGTMADGSFKVSDKIYIHDARFETAADFAAWISAENVDFVYPLAEPYTIQLEPQQLSTIDGTNFVWSNCGDTKAIFNLTPTASDSDKADKKHGVYYIEGTGTTAGTWLGSHEDIKEYYPGLNILYKIPVAGASTTKLNINDLGAVPVVKNVNTAVSTSYAAKSIVNLIYTLDGETAYWKTADYDTNTKNSAGTSNKVDTKLFLVGGGSQNSSGVTTYSNVGTYIGTDNYLYSNNNKVATETFVTNKIAEAELSGGDVDLSGYATKDELNAAVGNINYPVDSVNGKTGAVTLDASDVSAAPTSHASTATTYGVSSASNYGHAMASSTTPKALGTAAIGSETAKFARGDHVHALPALTSCTGTLTVAKGGTGATTAKDALVNLGLRVAPYIGSGDYSDITDLNNLTLTGLFQVPGEGFPNAPLTNPCFILNVKGTNDRTTQFGWRSNVTTASKNIYMRRQGDTVGTWDDWEIIAGPGLVSEYLPLSGGTLTGNLTISNSNNYSYLYLANQNGDNIGGLYASDSENRLYLINHAPNSTAGKYEGYGLPAVTTDNLTDHKWYKILTSKETVTVAQGGTGATDAATALSNLGGRKVYTSVGQLGLTAPVTTYAAYAALPQHSTLIVQSANKDQISDTPMSHGTVIIHKAHTYGYAECTNVNSSSPLFYKTNLYPDRAFDGWKQVITSDGGTLTGGLNCVLSSNNYYIRYRTSATATTDVASLRFNGASGYRRFAFTQQSAGTGGYTESYVLPRVSNSITANATYDILTTKSYVVCDTTPTTVVDGTWYLVKQG